MKIRYLMISIIIFAFVAILITFVGKVSVNLSDDSISIQGTLFSSTKISYEDISSIQYVESYDVGRRRIGFGTFKMNIGVYSNQEHKRYKVYTYRDVNGYVILQYQEQTLVFNLSTEEKTKEMYSEIKNRKEMLEKN